MNLSEERYEQLRGAAAEQVDNACDRFEAAWSQGGTPPALEDYLDGISAEVYSILLRELVELDVAYRKKRGISISHADYASRFPSLDATWLEQLAKYDTKPTSELPTGPVLLGLTEYQVLAEIGRGGMGVVYRAHDPSLDRPVAIKVLLPDAARDQERLQRFYREARVVSALNHPNICTIHAIKEWNGLPFLVLEWIEGQTLRLLLADANHVERLAPCMIQVAQALAAAHARGVVHRDIKPENVIVRPDGLVKVLDFSLARLSESRQPRWDEAPASPYETVIGTMMGTVPYMSPEQARGEIVDCESDIFSLGTMLYEMCTGHHPFLCGNYPETLRAIIASHPAEPIQLQPLLDHRLSQLILRALAKLPGQRPSATELVDTLQDIFGSRSFAYQLLPPETQASPADSRMTVGRQVERIAILSACESAALGRGSLIAVSGEPGIGKTTFVSDFLGELSRRGVITVAEGHCSERLAGSEAYLPILDSLESLLRGPFRNDTLRALERVAPTWYAQVASSIGSPPNAAISQERMKREFRSLVEELARPRPFVLFLDDIHWSDASTIDLLNYLCRDIGRIPFVIIGAFRPTDLIINNHPFHPLKLDLQSRGICSEIRLGFLQPQEVAEYVSIAYPQHAFPDSFISLLHDRTEGNPLFLMSLLRFLQERQAIGLEDSIWRLRIGIPDIVRDIPGSISSMIEKKLSLVDESDRRLLWAASVQGYEFDAAVVAQSMQLDPVDVEERLTVLANVHGLVRELRTREFPDGTLSLRFQFVHVLYQNSLYESLVPARRRTIASSVARALCDLYQDKWTSIASELALLWETARDWDRAADAFNCAAQHAVTLFAYQEAHHLAERGLEMVGRLPESPAKDRRAIQLHATLGAPLVAIKGYSSPEVGETQHRVYELSKRVGDYELEVQATRQLHSYQLLSGDVRCSYEQAKLFLSEARERQNTPAIVEALNCHGLSLIHLARVEESLAEFESAIQLCDSSTGSRLENLYAINPILRAKAAMGWGYWFIGRPDSALSLLQDTLALCKPQTPSFTLVHVHFITAFIHQLRGETEHVARLIENVLGQSTEQGFEFYQAIGTIWRGWVLGQRGELNAGLQQIVLGQQHCLNIGSRACEPYVLLLRAQMLAQSQSWEESLGTITHALASTESTSQRLYEPELYRLRGEILLQYQPENQFSAAMNDFHTAIQLASDRGLIGWTIRALTSLLRHEASGESRNRTHAQLHSLCSQMTEGTNTHDMQTARAALAEIPIT